VPFGLLHRAFEITFFKEDHRQPKGAVLRDQAPPLLSPPALPGSLFLLDLLLLQFRAARKTEDQNYRHKTQIK